MNENKFRSIARKAVVEYWNGNKKLVDKFGEITNQKVYVVWQCKAIRNLKGLMVVNVEGDGYYFEFTWNGDEAEGYLDVYKKQTHKTIKM